MSAWTIPTVTAILGGVVGAFCSFFLTKPKEIAPTGKKELNERQKKALGGWNGQIIEKGTSGQDNVQTKVKLSLFWSNKMEGEITLYYPGNKQYVLKLRAIFEYDDILQLSYHNKDKGVKQSGLAVLKLSNNGDELSGNYIGYGPIFKGIVNGRVRLSKL